MLCTNFWMVQTVQLVLIQQGQKSHCTTPISAVVYTYISMATQVYDVFERILGIR